MNWTRFLIAVAVSGVAASFTDWLFMGVLFHNKYLETPEIWRKPPGKPETSYILASTLFGVLACAALIFLFIWASALGSFSGAVRVAILAWLAAPLPVIGSNVIWMKMHPLLGVSHSLGWLARFVLTAAIAAWLIH
jgi:hypothetical protein